MAVYKLDFYQRSYYGPTSTPLLPTWSVLRDDAVDGIATLWIDYTHLQFGGINAKGQQVSGWTFPATARTNPPTADKIRVVRNGSNIPDDENDGAIVREQGVLSRPTFIDTIDASSAGKFLYYSFFVSELANGMWHRAGDIIRLVPKNYGYCTKLYDLLPQYYRDQDDLLIDQLSMARTLAGERPGRTSGPLSRFLCMIGFQFDQIRTEYESLRLVDDVFHQSGVLVPVVLNWFGFSYEPEMGMRQSRVLAENIIHLYKTKGTRVGIEGLASSVTGFGASVVLGKNFAIDPAIIDLFPTVINVATPPTMSSQVISSFPVPGTVPGAHPGAPPVLSPALAAGTPYPITAYWIPVGPASTVSFSTLNNGTPQTYGFPVEALQGQPIISSVFAWTLNAQVLTLDLKFFDRQGNLITTSSVAVATNVSAQTWTRVASGSATVPADTVSGGSITVSGAAWCEATIAVDLLQPNAPVYLGLEQIEVGTTVTPYQPPRDIRITLFANRINRVKNPSFESNTTAHWTAGSNTAVAASAAKPFIPPGLELATTYSGRVTSTAAGAMQVYTDLMPIQPGLLYNASAYFLAATAPQLLTVSMVFFDISNAPLLTVTSAPVLDAVPFVVADAAWTTSGVGTINFPSGTDAAWEGEPIRGAGIPTNAVLHITGPTTGEIRRYGVVTTPGADGTGLTIEPWVRVSVAMNARQPAPTGTVGVEVVCNWLNTSAGGEQHYFDCIMLEQSLTVGKYFDAGMFSSSDYRWEGTSDLSESLYYKRSSTKLRRLAQILTGTTTNVGGAPQFANGFLPAGMTFTLVIPQPV